MGYGKRVGDLLNFQISANYNMTEDDILKWKRAFIKASEILYNATEGQLRFGKIFLANNNVGLNHAEYIIYSESEGRSSGTVGDFGKIGRNIKLLAYAQTKVLTIVHELGHHLWALDDEYTGDSRHFTINKEMTLPTDHNNRIIPLVSADLEIDIDDEDFIGEHAILSFETNIETRRILRKEGDKIFVAPPFSQNPQDTNWESVLIQWVLDIECTGDDSTGACIMESYGDAAGVLRDDGTWEPKDDPITEFCTAANHDPDRDTAQHITHAVSCWETIVAHSGYEDLAVGAPADDNSANKVPPTGFVEPNWIELSDAFRFVLVLDCSGSMNSNDGTRLEDIKIGASFWLENSAIEGDHLAIIWFNERTETALALTDFATLTEDEIATLVSNIDNKTAEGRTNIRNGLDTALNQMLYPRLGAVNASLLLTDGVHNTPLGSSMKEVIPNYQENNANIYTLGVGTGAGMDLNGLDELSNDTGGSFFTVGDDPNNTLIYGKMLELNHIMRGYGLSTTQSQALPRNKKNDTLSKLKLDPTQSLKKRPKLSELIKKSGLESWLQLKESEHIFPGRFAEFILDVEENVEAATFTLFFAKHEKLWMYLIDPSGNEVHASSPEVVAFVANGQPYEFAKITKPKAGKWKVFAFRPNHGSSVLAKAFVGIKNKNLNVFASAKYSTNEIHFTAGARYFEPLTGIGVIAILRDEENTLFQVTLKDDDETGDYNAVASLSPGHYTGYIEIQSPGNTMMANYHYIMSHTKNIDKIPNLLVKYPAFIRHVPISFYTGARTTPVEDEDELNDNQTKSNKKIFAILFIGAIIVLIAVKLIG